MTPLGWAAAAPAVALVVVDDLDTSTDEAERSISGPDGHHLQRVRRIGIDEQVVVADGAGHWYLARVTNSDAGVVTVERAGPTRLEPELRPRLTIAFAPAKSDHGNDVVHQLVEIGVDRIIPLVAERSVVRWDGDRGVRALERLRRVARTAAMQSHRARLPVVDAPTPVASIATSEGLILADRDGESIDSVGVPQTREWCGVIGPEGGFTDAEIAVFGAVPRVAIGPHVLRSVTAPIALASALGTRRGP